NGNPVRTFPIRLAVVIEPSHGGAVALFPFDDLDCRTENIASDRPEQGDLTLGTEMLGGQNRVKRSDGMAPAWPALRPRSRRFFRCHGIGHPPCRRRHKC